MQVQKSVNIYIVVFRLIADPIGKAARFHSFERAFPGETLRAGTIL